MASLRLELGGVHVISTSTSSSIGYLWSTSPFFQLNLNFHLITCREDGVHIDNDVNKIHGFCSRHWDLRSQPEEQGLKNRGEGA